MELSLFYSFIQILRVEKVQNLIEFEKLIILYYCTIINPSSVFFVGIVFFSLSRIYDPKFMSISNFSRELWLLFIGNFTKKLEVFSTVLCVLANNWGVHYVYKDTLAKSFQINSQLTIERKFFVAAVAL